MCWGSGIAVSCGVGHRRGLGTTLLWLWRRRATTVPIQPLAWKPPYAAGAALKRQKERGKEGREERKEKRKEKGKKEKEEKETGDKPLLEKQMSKARATGVWHGGVSTWSSLISAVMCVRARRDRLVIISLQSEIFKILVFNQGFSFLVRF